LQAEVFFGFSPTLPISRKKELKQAKIGTSENVNYCNTII
jgi:hypothetical protein